MFKKISTLLGIALLFMQLGFAQQYVPQAFSYQCVVRDAAGNALGNQTVVLVMNVRSGSPNGPIAYAEKHTVSTNEFGLITLGIGQGTALQGDFPAINWSGGAKYIEVTLETSPGVYDALGVSQLLSVPYAQYALSSGSGGGGQGDNWGTQTVQTDGTLNGNGTPFNLLKIAQNGAVAGQVLKWNGTQWVPQDDLTNIGQNGGTVTQINTATGLSGGPITTSGTISLTNTGVTPGIYGSATEIPVVTIDAQGRISSVFTQVVQPGTVGINGGPGIGVAQQGTTFTLTNTGDTNAFDDLTNTAQANGDVTGTFSNLQLKSESVSSLEIANGTIIGNDINSMDAAIGQVLKWTGSNWVPQNDNSGITAVTIAEGPGIDVTGSSPNFTVTNTGDPDASDDLTVNSAASGDVTGFFSNLQIAGAAVGTTELATQSVTGSKIDDMGATSGQVLKWNGFVWAPAADATGTTTVGAGTGILVTGGSGNYTVTNIGDTDPDDDLTLNSIAAGDVAGSFFNLQLQPGVVNTTEVANSAITGAKIDDMGANSGQVLKWNGFTWAPADDATGGAGGGNSYTGGTGIQVVGSAPNYVINNTGDLSATNELQSISLSGTVLTLSNGGGSVTLPAGGNNYSYSSGFGIQITGAAPNFTISNTGDGDNNPNNELQTLALTGTTLSISNGNAVDLSGLGGGGIGGQWANAGTSIYNTNTGNIGMGTNTPLNKLDLNGDQRIRFNSSATAPLLTLEETELDYARLLFKNTGANGNWLLGGRGGSVGLNGDFGISFIKNTGAATRVLTAIGDGRVGVNTADPSAPLHVVGDDLNVKVQGTNPRIGFYPNAAGGLDNPAQKGYIWQQSNHLDLGTNTDTVTVRLTPGGVTALAAQHTGNVAVGTTDAGNYRLQVLHGDYGLNLQNAANNHRWELWTSDNNGSLVLFNDQLPANTAAGFFAANGTYTSSDRRLKKDINPLSPVLERIQTLRPVSYHLIHQKETEAKTLGFIAQEVQEIFPEMVAETDGRGNNDHYLAINYTGFGVLAIKAIQEQQAELERIKQENAQLKSRLDALETRLNKLEKQ